MGVEEVMTFSIEDAGFKRYGHHVKVETASNGDTTLARVWVNGEILGEGVALRKKGDPRNQMVGDALALARAFGEASSHLYEVSQEEGGWGLRDELAVNLKETLKLIEAAR
jgi:hypothetical protein